MHNIITKYCFRSNVKSHLQMLALSTNCSLNKALDLAYSSVETTKSKSNEEPPEPIVILHGLFGSKQNWKSISKALHAKTNRKVN